MGSSSVVVVALLCIALGSVVPLSQAAVAGTKPAFDWTQFIKGVKRAVDTDVAVPDTEEVDIDYQDSQFQIKPMVSNPMSPFLSLKPFLPTKPTFVPPVVDPQYFIDKKTALLNGLFSPTGPVGGKAMGPPPFLAPNYFAGKKTAFLSTLFGQLATPPPQTVNANATQSADADAIQRRLVAPWLTTPPPAFDPKVMTDKKTAFLDKLFSSFNTATSEDESTIDTATAKPTIVPPSFWMPLPPKPAVKPTIVPPDFWLPFPATKPVVDPSVFVDKKTKFLNDLMSSLDATAAPPTEPPTYDDKVGEFLDRLLEALTAPTVGLKRSLVDATGNAPGTVPTQVPLDAKDKLMDTFIGELTGIKNNIVDTVTQMIKTQKEAAIVSPPMGAKPGKKAGPPFAALWGPMAKLKPTPDPTIPFQQKIDVLNQMFDMLTDLQKDVVTAVNAAGLPTTTTTTPVKNATNTTILGLLRKKLMEMDDGTSSKYGPETRSIKMAVRQGYQSLPPGTTELLQAGGGSSPQGKEGGGISLQIVAPA